MIHELAEKINKIKHWFCLDTKSLGQEVQELRMMLRDYYKTYSVEGSEDLDSMNIVQLIRLSELIISIDEIVTLVDKEVK